MATMIATQVGAKQMTKNEARPQLQNRPDLQEIVKDILALRAMTRTDNFLTHKSQRALMAHLTPQELAVVARAIAESEK